MGRPKTPEQLASEAEAKFIEAAALRGLTVGGLLQLEAPPADPAAPSALDILNEPDGAPRGATLH